MKENKTTYFSLIIFHLLLGIMVFVFPFVSKIYALAIPVFSLFYLLKTQNKNNEALLLAAYVIGAEVFLRMTQGNFFEQYAKYVVIGIMVVGMMYKGFSKYSFVYWLFGLFLLPGILLSFYTLNFDTDIRKAITFNVIGPVCLAVCSIYCYQRQITFQQIKNILNTIAYPLMAMLVYLYLYTPNLKDVVTSTESNFETSGGYGPNQVATILGLGIFVFFTKIVLGSKEKFFLIVNAIFFIAITYRGIITFSRGGIITGFLMIVVLLVFLYLYTNAYAKFKIIFMLFIGLFVLFSIWTYSSMQTDGLINKRYANQDAKGREKTSKLTGREKLIESEFEMFLDNPILGIGVGKNKEYRLETTGIEAASHNEVTRMLAEHGIFGIINLLILLITPIVLYLNNKQNLFLFSFLLFWLLTINHAAMRLTAPAFIYALSLLKVKFTDEAKIIIYRKSAL